MKITGQVGGDHYEKMKIQPTEYIIANDLGFCEGCIIKYISRWKDKNGIEDLKKIIHYCNILINNEVENKRLSPDCPNLQETDYIVRKGFRPMEQPVQFKDSIPESKKLFNPDEILGLFDSVFQKIN